MDDKEMKAPGVEVVPPPYEEPATEAPGTGMYESAAIEAAREAEEPDAGVDFLAYVRPGFFENGEFF